MMIGEDDFCHNCGGGADTCACPSVDEQDARDLGAEDPDAALDELAMRAWEDSAEGRAEHAPAMAVEPFDDPFADA